MMAAYDPIADWYAAQVRSGSLQAVSLDHLARGLLEMAGDVSGKRVLDAGCGEGHVARLFARHGAEVVAVDISPRLLHLARTFEAQDPHEIEFIEADLAQGLPSHRGAFDLATANMMLDDCEDLAGVLCCDSRRPQARWPPAAVAEQPVRDRHAGKGRRLLCVGTSHADVRHGASRV